MCIFSKTKEMSSSSSFFSDTTLSFISIHFTVFLWGFTAILGKLISYSSFLLVWHRMTITFLIYCLLPQTYSGMKQITFKQLLIYTFIGIIVCLHWLSFYGSIKIGDSASVTLACLGSVAFFSSLFEPLFLGTTHSFKDILLGMIVLIGVLFIYISLPEPPKNTNVSYKWAIIIGLISAMLGSLFTILNKKYIQQASPLVISAIEMGSGSLFLSIIVPIMYGKETKWYPTIDTHHLTTHSFRDGSLDLIWVLILSILCTNLTFYLSTYSLNHLSAFTINLKCNLEPIYGIVLGALFFHENKHLNREFYIGTTVILIVIFLNPILDFCQSNKNSTTNTTTTSAANNEKSNGRGDGSPVRGSSYSNHNIQTIKNHRKEIKSTTGDKEMKNEEEESLIQYYEKNARSVHDLGDGNENNSDGEGYEGDEEERIGTGELVIDGKKEQQKKQPQQFEMRRI